MWCGVEVGLFRVLRHADSKREAGSGETQIPDSQISGSGFISVASTCVHSPPNHRKKEKDTKTERTT